MKSSRTATQFLAVGAVGLAVVAASAGSIALAAPVSWGSAQNITGDSDVSSTGSLLYAYNFGRNTVASTTVNGVTFAPFVVPDNQTSGTVGSVTISESPLVLYGYDVEGSSIAPFANLSSSYKSLLNAGASALGADTITLQLGGLTPGYSYDVQWWSNNSSGLDIWYMTTASANNSVSLLANTLGSPGDAGVDGGIGQFAIGTFTADSTSQSITFNAAGPALYYPLINAFQVRVTAVPEPSTYCMALAGIACCGWQVMRRRRTR